MRSILNPCNALLIAAAVVATSSTSSAQMFRPSGFNNPFKSLETDYIQDYLKLTPTQKDLIRGLMLQMEGPEALRRDEIAQELQMSDSQRKDVEQIYIDHKNNTMEFQREYRDLMKVDPRKARIRSAELQLEGAKLGDKVLDVLTEVQKKRYERLQGPPFDRQKYFESLQKPQKKRSDL